MELPIYQVDAFTSELFKGNPAAVVPLEEWLPDDMLQNIAIENNLSETAFFIPDGDDFYLRWFTPTYEIDLCGHATMATAFVILTQLYPDRNTVHFNTNVAGKLTVDHNDGWLKMDFPSRPGERINNADIPDVVLKALDNKMPMEAYKARDLMLVFDDENFVRTVEPDFGLLKSYPDAVCITTTTKEDGIDFISRFLCAYDPIPEDPVTGSAHCTLIPYWAKTLNKTKLSAYQASERGGHLKCILEGDRVEITGKAALYLKGTIYV